MAISTRWSRSPVTRPDQSPSIMARPSSSRPSSAKNERLDAREEASRRPEPPDFQYDDEWLARTAALFLGLGFAAPPIEERAQEIAAVATRERFAVLDAHAQGAASGGVRLHADLIMLARLASALTRARAV